MKEVEPTIKKTSVSQEVKRIVLLPAVFAAMLAASTSIAAIMRVVAPPEDKYRMEIKVVPSKDGNDISLKVKLIKQCIDSVVNSAPGPASKVFYKDCE